MCVYVYYEVCVHRVCMYHEVCVHEVYVCIYHEVGILQSVYVFMKHVFIYHGFCACVCVCVCVCGLYHRMCFPMEYV